MKVPFKRLTTTAKLPTYAKKGDAGLDLYADIINQITIKSGQRALIKTGLSVAIPEGFEMQIRPRSGLALNHGITVLNSPGTIDSGYRGEIGVILLNTYDKDFVVNYGDKIAQAVVAPFVRAEIIEVDCLDETERGRGGFGHSGV